MKIVFIGDNRNRLNWGCRATSIALKDMISENNDIFHTVYGDVTLNYKSKMPSLLNKIIRKLGKHYTIVKRLLYFLNLDDFICGDVDRSLNQFDKRICNGNFYDVLDKKIKECDALVVNGEGSFIFSKSYRRDTIFYLLLLKKAQSYNKKTYCVNLMLSDCPKDGRNDYTIKQTIDIFNKCDLVSLRDPQSCDYAHEVMSFSKFSYVPDALFSWGKYKMIFPIVKQYPYSFIPFPEKEEYWKSFNFIDPYICVSGSSSAAWDQGAAIRSYKQLVMSLKKIRINVFVVPTCNGDRFLYEVAKQTNTPVIPTEINILNGMAILANAKAFVSGRWHPSILASLGGTPCIFLGSNSSKTISIQRMLQYKKLKEYNSLPTLEDIENIVKDVNIILEKNNEYRTKIQHTVNNLTQETLIYKDISICSNPK